MVITFPHMGNIYLAVKAFCEALGIDCIAPCPNSKATLKAGAFLSPEEICLPFKIMMGNFIESLGRGADTILITGSCGPCRFGEYCELQMKLLARLGCKADVIVLDSPFDIGKDEFWSRIGRITKGTGASRMKKLDSLRQALAVLRLADEADALAHGIAGYESNPGECRQLLFACKAAAFEATGPSAMRSVLTHYIKRLSRVKLERSRSPVRIALVGEIYSMIEPFSNFFIEERLMDMGVCSTRLLTPSWWVKDLVLKPLKLNSPQIKADAKRYLPVSVGGHARETVAHVVQAKRAHMDGVIQVFPLGCMPEIVVKSILPAIHKDTGLPFMTLVVDEVTGEAGYLTRIEAFVDMLEKQKEKMHA